MSHQRLLWTLVQLALVGALGSCTLVSEFGQKQCSVDDDCHAGNTFGFCTSGLCQEATCNGTEDCTTRGGQLASTVCVENLCSGAQCSSDDDCHDGNVFGFCEASVCQPAACTATEECVARGSQLAETVCVNQLCAMPQCMEDGECGMGTICVGGACVDEEETRWGCVDDRATEGMVDGTTVTYRTLVKVLNGTNSEPAGQDLDVFACQTPLCDNAAGPFKPDEEGWVDVVVNRGFQGLLRMTNDTSLPTLLDIKTPVNEDQETDIVRLLNSGLVGALAGLSGTTAELDTKGMVLVQVRDCIDGRAEGIVVTTSGTDRGETIFYVDGSNLPANSATATDAAGVAGVVNLEPGLPRVNLIREVTSQLLLDFTVTIQAGTVTYVRINLGG